ncbi:hypothetical protein QTH89_20700 [Variovorax sp. J22G21]|uniref:hypothetical protein n=1 Tax=Variovorax fucosicus TaxID=3053517 RepID=UPI0025765A9D|nr:MULTISPECIES: hypothetical protein [unclassified Variovorax]MDM0038864.1 hypothetical protein [Variovorax sp. J22R193]MDM0055526.1 hypothetical protein [Variovorax sp. J22G47]MDM0063640.1 hypothetical protein [Variovorax sp. J22G21]
MERRDFSSAGFWLLAAPMLLLAFACSPTFNWRDVAATNAELKALMPCKPDRAERRIPLGSETVSVQMAGCEAGGATFAVAHARADNVAQAEAWLAAWRAGTRAQWQAATGGQIQEGPVSVVRAAASPAPWQIEARGAGPDGKPTEARVRWFAHAQRDGSVAIYQATVLGKPSAADATGTFFDGLRLP